MKHCQRHGPASDPYCVECYKDERERTASGPLDAAACSADELLSALEQTIQTNGKEIINRMIEIAKMDTTDPNAGWDGVIFCRAAITMLSQQNADGLGRRTQDSDSK